MRTPAGNWCIAQLSSATAAVSSLVGKGLATPGIVGYGPRIPASFLFNADQSVNLTVLNNHRAYSLSRDKAFKPRVIWGKYTPAWAMGPRLSGFAGPAPYGTNGSANTVFEAAQRKLGEAIANWSVGKDDVREYDCGWYSLNYSELYFGPEVQNAYGYSRATNETYTISAHKRLIDLNHGICSAVGLPVGFGLSGHGPIGNISDALGAHASTKPLGSVFVQANGWAQTGEWGGALESTHDQNIWVDLRGKVACGLQDISAPAPRTAADVDKMWDNAKALVTAGTLIVYTESYFYEWDDGVGNFHDDLAAFTRFKQRIGSFVPANLPPDNADELAALKALLASLEAQVPPLEAEVASDAAAEGNALTAYQQAQAEANDSEARLTKLEAEIAVVEAKIKVLEGGG